LKGLSTNDFKSALAGFLGEGTMGLSPASIVKLKKIWESEFAVWEKRKITKRYAYICVGIVPPFGSNDFCEIKWGPLGALLIP
jgi:hypothetical protein